MGIAELQPLWAIGLLAAIALTGAVYDLRFRRIPNWLCAVALACGIALAFLGSSGAVGSHALHALVVLIVGLIFFRLKMFGGGDVKFYTGIASFFPLSNAVLLLLCVSLSGVALLAVWFISRRLARIPIRGKNGARFDELPYGIAIGVGAVFAKML